MTILAVIRPDEWELPLLVHVLGATILVGGLVSSAGVLVFARGDATLLRLGYWSLLAIALPGWIVMRVGAAWIADESGWADVSDEPTWLQLGGAIADLGGLVLLVALVVGGIGVYRLRTGNGSGLLRVTLVLALVLVAAYVVAAWAMAGKPD